ncbi:MAG: prolyl oligopeptidase family serine peptidase [Streptosporangiales bacterium]|nr:prolyl oligopeptidase family serine peptidase [Streptosporangiales bacterium]
MSTPFHDLSAYAALPRVSSLVLSPDGARLVATVSVLSTDEKSYVSSLWEVDVAGERPATRLTRSTKGESAPAFSPDGGLLFVSDRPDPGDADGAEQAAGLWRLPAGGGEAERLVTRAGGVSGVGVAAEAGTVVVAAGVLPGAVDGDDTERRRERRDRSVSAILHTSARVRYWDHDLGPDEPHLLAVDGLTSPDLAVGLRDLTAEPGRALDEASFDVARDGRWLVTSWKVPHGHDEVRVQLRTADLVTGETRVLLDDERFSYEHPAISPDGRWVAAVRETRPTYDEPADLTLVVVPADGGQERDLLPDLDRWPGGPVWSHDGAAVLTTTDETGRGRIVRVDLGSGAVTALTGDDGVYAALQPSPDGSDLYALRTTVDEPATPVRLDPALPDQRPERLRGPAERPALPGTLTEVETTADDGCPLRAWLALPHGAGPERPAPMLLWVHGGPAASWNQWQWRWNPWLMVARGYAVLLPDPALSTGYGIDFHRRGWGTWGERPYTDLMAVTDAVVARPDIDAGRTAAMGGSFGGYMANWIATQTDRFTAIVTHASLWALDEFCGTTDLPAYWRSQFGDPLEQPDRYERNSPHRHAGRITTPMLVIHGDKDYRVPIGEGLRLYSDLVHHGVDATFLYYPDENHWILKPGNAAVWYDTVFAFLAHHVLGEEWRRPASL